MDCPLKLGFSVFGNGKYGDLLGNETMDNALGCAIIGHPEIDIFWKIRRVISKGFVTIYFSNK